MYEIAKHRIKMHEACMSIHPYILYDTLYLSNYLNLRALQDLYQPSMIHYEDLLTQNQHNHHQKLEFSAKKRFNNFK